LRESGRDDGEDDDDEKMDVDMVVVVAWMDRGTQHTRGISDGMGRRQTAVGGDRWMNG